MDATARETYLNTQVMTATPQKLQLMLIDGAIRFANQAITLWQDGDGNNATESLTRCRRIVTEILGGVKQDGSQLPKQINSIYMFIFRQLTEAQLEQNQDKVQDVIKVLEIEQETWRKVCQLIASSDTGLSDAGSGSPAIPDTSSIDAAAQLPRDGFSAIAGGPIPTQPGLSFEA